MRLSCQMDYAIDFVSLYQLEHHVKITDVSFDKQIVRLVFYILKILKITGIGQFVDIDYAILRILIDEKAHNMASDKTRASGDDYVSLKVHLVYLFSSSKTQQMLAILILCHRLSDLSQLVSGDPALFKSNCFQASDLQTLPFLYDLDECRSF